MNWDSAREFARLLTSNGFFVDPEIILQLDIDGFRIGWSLGLLDADRAVAWAEIRYRAGIRSTDEFDLVSNLADERYKVRDLLGIIIPPGRGLQANIWICVVMDAAIAHGGFDSFELVPDTRAFLSLWDDCGPWSPLLRASRHHARYVKLANEISLRFRNSLPKS